MTIEQRLGKLMSALTARERAILVLHSLKEGTEEDRLWRLTMPPEQSREFSRCIAYMNSANLQLAHIITYIEGVAEKMELRTTWLTTLQLWELSLAEIDFAASRLAIEPITESAYESLLAKASREYVPVGQLASELAEEERAWSDDDLEKVPWAGDLIVKDEAWQRLVRGSAARLLAAVESGRLPARRKAKAGWRYSAPPSTSGWEGRRPSGPSGPGASTCGRTKKLLSSRVYRRTCATCAIPSRSRSASAKSGWRYPNSWNPCSRT